MRCTTPVLVFRSLALASMLALAACGDDADDAAPTTTQDAETTTTEVVDVDGDTSTETTAAAETTTTTTEAEAETTTETTAASDDEEPIDDVAALCSAYLESLTPAGFDSGLDALAELLGDDAPSGVLGAIDTLQDPDNDIEAFFSARNSIDGYVLPICDERFRSGIVPEADNATAAAAFIDALRDGDRTGAERIAPTNVVVQFDWVGYPEIQANVDDDNATINMILEPTVTAFCQLDAGAIEFCAFGE